MSLLFIMFYHCIFAILFPQQSLPIADSDSHPQLIAKQFSFTEGPTADKNGVVYFTDQPNNTIWKYSEDGLLTLFLDKAGRSNGMYFYKNKLIACADEKNELWLIDSKGKATVLLNNFEGRKLNGPNDVWVTPKGDIYFTDPYYQRPYWTRKESELKGEYVYYLAKGTRKPVIVADDLLKPNGIVGTPDGDYLYVADIKDKKTYRYRIETNGKLKDKTLFAEQGSDGMTIDHRGNVYLTGDGVTVYNPQGKRIKKISVPHATSKVWTSNVCFFGKKNNLLFITAQEGIYFMPMLVRGAK